MSLKSRLDKITQAMAARLETPWRTFTETEDGQGYFETLPEPVDYCSGLNGMPPAGARIWTPAEFHALEAAGARILLVRYVPMADLAGVEPA